MAGPPCSMYVGASASRPQESCVALVGGFDQREGQVGKFDMEQLCF